MDGSVLLEDGCQVVYTYVRSEPGQQEQPQPENVIETQVIRDESWHPLQEVILLDEESGQFESYIYVPPEQQPSCDLASPTWPTVPEATVLSPQIVDWGQLKNVLLVPDKEVDNDTDLTHLEPQPEDESYEQQVDVETEAGSEVLVEQDICDSSELVTVVKESPVVAAHSVLPYVDSRDTSEVEEESVSDCEQPPIQIEIQRLVDGDSQQVVIVHSPDPVLQTEDLAVKAGSALAKESGACHDPCVAIQDHSEHTEELHLEPDPNCEYKECCVCGGQVAEKHYIKHFKTLHSDVRLGCPQCPLSYRSPELLNLHYNRSHVLPPGQSPATQLLLASSPQLSPKVVVATAAACAPLKAADTQLKSHKTLFPLLCDICHKSYNSQREFTNHRRRKGFCKRPVLDEPPAPKRRIGIIRKSV